MEHVFSSRSIPESGHHEVKLNKLMVNGFLGKRFSG
jgi:hypothetical protein